MTTRRQLTILLSIGLILFIGFAYLSGDSDIEVFGLLAMLPLGLVQFLSSLINTIRGSKLQGIHLFVSVLYLIAGFLLVFEFVSVPDYFFRFESFLYFGIPYLLAIGYVLILFFDPVRQPKVNAGSPQDVLDDDNWVD